MIGGPKINDESKMNDRPYLLPDTFGRLNVHKIWHTKPFLSINQERHIKGRGEYSTSSLRTKTIADSPF